MPKHLGLCGASDWVDYEDDHCDCDLIKEARTEVLDALRREVEALRTDDWNGLWVVHDDVRELIDKER